MKPPRARDEEINMDEVLRKRYERKSTFLDWCDQEGLSVITGYGVDDLKIAPLKYWERLDGPAAYCHLEGSQGFVGVLIAVQGVGGAVASAVSPSLIMVLFTETGERAKAVGASENRIVWYHIFPNAFSLVFAEAILTIAVAILTESFLSFLGLGPANVITWGKLIDQAINGIAIERKLIWWIFAPGFAIVIVVMGFTLLGYSLDEIFNPRLRKR